MIIRLSFPIAALAMLVAGCATAPKPLQGEFSAAAPQDAAAGDRVRWGGDIIAVEPGADRTCFEILGRALTEQARPRDDDTTIGRFLACREGFYDPALFAEDREITVIGDVADFETRPIGEYAYRYPRVDAEVIFLWPERAEREVYYAAPIGWYPSYYGYGWGYRWHPYRVRSKPAEAPAAAEKRSESR